jgi:ABC-type transporter Mla subunit MlaD
VKSKNILFTFLAWLQLTVSVLLALAIIWGYVNFQASVGQFVRSLAASISAVSDVVIRTAETVEARRALLDETQQVLVDARTLLTAIRATTESMAKQGPQLARGLNATSDFLGQIADPMQSIGDRLMVMSVPNIQLIGIKPIVTFTRPFEEVGSQLKAEAQRIKAVSASLTGITAAMDQDGQKLGSSLIATSDQTMKALIETEKTLDRLKSQDLPKAIENLKATSENLRNLSTQVDRISNVGPVLLVVGLLLAVWCFLHSLGALLLAHSYAIGPGIQQGAATINP